MNQTPLEKAQAVQAARRAMGILPERLDPLEKAAANPKSKALAIKAKCYDCVGRDADPGWRDRVRGCQIMICPLWNVRMK